MIGRAKLTRKELMHSLCAIPNTINKRPITTLTEDPDDLRPLTPSLFFQDIPVSGLPEFTCVEACQFRAAYKKVREVKEALQARFRKEYLSQMVQAVGEKKRNLHVGELVLVESDNRKRFEWPLGGIVKLFPERDGEVRVAEVKTASGNLIRPLQRLYPLETVENHNLSEIKILSKATHTNEDSDLDRDVVTP